MAIRLVGPSGTWTLPDGETFIGRGERCGVRINDPRLSRQHARIVVTAQRALIHDTGSANGVLVNGDRIQAPTLLRPGDTVVCGPVLLEVVTDEERNPSGIRSQFVAETPRPFTGDRQRSTETMEAFEIDQVATGRHGSRINPAIAAALSDAEPPKSDSTSIRPSEMVPAVTASALTPGHGQAPTEPPTPRRTTNMVPSEEIGFGTAALVADGGRAHRPARRERLLAGIADPLLVLGPAVVGGLLLAAGGALAALRWSGAGVADGRISLPGAPPASIGDLLHALAAPDAWNRLGELARQLHAQPAAGPFLLLFLSAAVGAVVIEAALLLGLVATTVQHGGPWLHRRLGLAIVVRRNGHFPGWPRALWRWLLLAATSPLAVVSAALGWRGIHDLMSGCEVRRR